VAGCCDSRACDDFFGDSSREGWPSAIASADRRRVLSGELFRLNIEVRQFLDRFDLKFFQDV
jgi:hypothetical protein